MMQHRSPSPPRQASPGLADELVSMGQRQGLAAVGIADASIFVDTRRDLLARREQGLHGGMQFTYRNPVRSTDPDLILPGARALVVGAWGYQRAERPGDDGALDSAVQADAPGAGEVGLDAKVPVGRVARYAWRDHYDSLRRALAPIADRVRADGWRATVVCDDNALVDRAAAHRAGLGWFGKNALMLLPGLGSWFLLGSVVTDAPLLAGQAPATPAPHASGCGSCARCMTACPTGALVAPGVLDARRCLAWVVQAPGSIPLDLREALGGRVYGCDECQTTCPINRTADRHRGPVPAEPDSHATVDLVDLLDSSDQQLLAAHGRWYIAGREPRYLRRNALVALGNTGDGNDPATGRVVDRALRDPDPIIAEHAAWTARRLGRDDLVDRLE